MDFGANYRKLGELPVQPWIAAMQGLEGWTDVGAKAYEVHAQAMHLALKGFDVHLGYVWPEMDRFAHLLPDLRKLLLQLGPGYVNNTNFARLPAGKSVGEHIDVGFVMCHSHRVHFCITSNPNVLFSVGGEVITMKPGEVWEINNCRMHGIKNQGDTDRIHLMIDWFPTMTAMQKVECLMSEGSFLFLGDES